MLKKLVKGFLYFIAFSVIAIVCGVILYLKFFFAPHLKDIGDILDKHRRGYITKSENHCKELFPNNPKNYELCKIDKYCEYMHHPEQANRLACMNCLKLKTLRAASDIKTEEEEEERTLCIWAIRGYLDDAGIENMDHPTFLQNEQFKDFRRKIKSLDTKKDDLPL